MIVTAARVAVAVVLATGGLAVGAGEAEAAYSCTESYVNGIAGIAGGGWTARCSGTIPIGFYEQVTCSTTPQRVVSGPLVRQAGSSTARCPVGTVPVTHQLFVGPARVG